MNCLILYGLEGYEQENWFSWLKEELNKTGIKTEIPNLPDSGNPDLSVWLNYLNDYRIDENTVLVGHSLGAVLILRLLEKEIKIKAAFLVAAFSNDLDWEVLKKSNFFRDKFNWKKIKENCPYFEVLTSKNDPYLKVGDGEVVAKNLQVENQILDVYRHFNMKEFSLLLEKIKNIN